MKNGPLKTFLKKQAWLMKLLQRPLNAKDLLMNPVYTGAIASQKKDYRFKIGTIGEKKPEEDVYKRQAIWGHLALQAVPSRQVLQNQFSVF